jgi:hypothetical protein
MNRITEFWMHFNFSMPSSLQRFVCMFVLSFIVVTAAAAGAQNRPGPPSTQQGPPEDEGTIRMKKDMAKKANTERHESLKRDTDRLLELAQQLKDQVDKSNENMLSLDVLKKAEEVEKLAHNVKEKMKGY